MIEFLSISLFSFDEYRPANEILRGGTFILLGFRALIPFVAEGNSDRLRELNLLRAITLKRTFLDTFLEIRLTFSGRGNEETRECNNFSCR